MAVCSLWERFVKVRFLPTRFHTKANKLSNPTSSKIFKTVKIDRLVVF